MWYTKNHSASSDNDVLTRLNVILCNSMSTIYPSFVSYDLRRHDRTLHTYMLGRAIPWAIYGTYLRAIFQVFKTLPWRYYHLEPTRGTTFWNFIVPPWVARHSIFLKFCSARRVFIKRHYPHESTFTIMGADSLPPMSWFPSSSRELPQKSKTLKKLFPS